MDQHRKLAMGVGNKRSTLYFEDHNFFFFEGHGLAFRFAYTVPYSTSTTARDSG